jgi:hypothetical protein
MVKANKASNIAPYIPTPESIQMRKEIEEIYAGIIPAMRRAFAHYVYKQGQGATHVGAGGKRESWQAIGRRLYGPKFMEDMKAVIEENRVVATQ